MDKKYRLPPFNNKTDIDEQNFALPFAYQDIPIKFNQAIMKDSCKNEFSECQKNKE